MADEANRSDRSVIVLVYPGRQRFLTEVEAERVLDRSDVVAREATRWRLSVGRNGRLLLVDPGLIGEVEALLAEEEI